MSTFGHPPRLRAVSTITALLLLASGCGGGSPSTPGPTASPTLVSSEVPSEGETLTGKTTAGEVAASATIDPYEAAVIEATGPDGSTYRLAIEAASVRQPTVVSLRPLSSISFGGATLLAGVDIEPSGLKLFVPAVLTIVPATHGSTTVPTVLEYVGTADASTARIAAVTSTSSAAAYELVLTHFSGGIVTNLTPDTETSLFDAFSASHSLPNTPEGRQARAETGLRTVKWAEDRGRMDHETATQRTADYEREWWEAEADRVRDDPALNTKIKNGDPADADTISAEIARMIEAAKRVQDAGGEASTTAIEAMGLAAEYGEPRQPPSVRPRVPGNPDVGPRLQCCRNHRHAWHPRAPRS